MQQPCLFVAATAKTGRGVFTSKKIVADTVVEIAPVIVMTHEDKQLLNKTLLYNYIFDWGKEKDRCCMALGLVPIYNHSYQSNCEYFMDFEEDTILIKTVREVKRGEELTINYNGDWDDDAKIWFETAE